MGTRGAIAIGTPTKWSGVYQHWDSYPGGLGKDVWAMLNKENGIETFKESIVKHPGGWSSWPDKCYCHDPHFAERDGSCAPDSEFYREDAHDQQLDQDSADPLFIEWVYVLDEPGRVLHILEGQYQIGFRLAASVDLGDAEPDWASFGG